MKTDNQDVYGYIYKTTNLINGKIYVGRHKSKFFDSKYYGSGRLLLRSISKYGKENFTCEVIEWVNSVEEANQREIYWINKLNARDRAIGYNITRGGDGTGGNLVQVNKDGKLLYITSQELPEYLDDGYTVGRPFYPKPQVFKEKQRELNLGLVGVHLGTHKIKVKHDQLDQYLNYGYSLGFLDEDKKVKIVRAKASADGVGPKKWMFNGNDYKLVPQSAQESYLRDGWVFKCVPRKSSAGHRKPISAITRFNLSQSHKGKHQSQAAIEKQREKLTGRVVINKNNENKLVSKEQLEEYLHDGWILGRANHLDKRSRKVVCYETGEVFLSISKASNAYPKCGGVRSCLRRKAASTCGGYHWYFIDDNERKQEIESIFAIESSKEIKSDKSCIEHQECTEEQLEEILANEN